MSDEKMQTREAMLIAMQMEADARMQRTIKQCAYELGIPAATLAALRAGTHVVVKRKCIEEMQEAVTDTPDDASKERALTAVYEWCEAVICGLAAAPELGHG